MSKLAIWNLNSESRWWEKMERDKKKEKMKIKENKVQRLIIGYLNQKVEYEIWMDRNKKEKKIKVESLFWKLKVILKFKFDKF